MNIKKKEWEFIYLMKVIYIQVIVYKLEIINNNNKLI